MVSIKEKSLGEDFANRNTISEIILKKFVRVNKIYDKEHLAEQITLCDLDEWKEETPEFISGLMILKNDWGVWKGVLREFIETGLEFHPRPIVDGFLFSVFDRFTNYLEIAKVFVREQPIYYDTGKNWWIWNHGEFRWERVDETDLMNALDRYTKNPSVNGTIKNEIIESLKRVGREKTPKPVPPYWIQFKDTIVDIKTGKEKRASPEYFITNPIPWKLHPERFVNTPVLDRIFEEWVGKDYVKTLYEIIAYCLIPDYPINRLFCFIGGGMNGKSKFLELLCKFIGQHNCTSTELDVLLNSRFEVTRLHKKLVCQMGETNFNEMSKTSILKKLTGGDLIGFEYKNKNPFHEINYAKILISTNSLPTTTDKTIGFYRRWMIIDFPNQFSEQKNILEEIPEEEYESLALKCCFILKDLLEARKFHKEGSVEERMERYESRADFLQKFIEDFTEPSEPDEITKSDFYKKFKEWCRERRHREISETSLSKKMKEKGIIGGKKYYNWMYDGKGGDVRIWEGIRWK